MLIHSDQRCLVWSRPPSRRTILVNFRNHLGDHYNHYFLSFPEVIFASRVYRCETGVRAAHPLFFLFREGESLFEPPLLNVYSRDYDFLAGKVCMGTTDYKHFYSHDNLLAQGVTAAFFNSVFNEGVSSSGLGDYGAQRGASPVGSLSQWQERTKAEPSWKPTAPELIFLRPWKEWLDRLVQFYGHQIL